MKITSSKSYTEKTAIFYIFRVFLEESGDIHTLCVIGTFCQTIASRIIELAIFA